MPMANDSSLLSKNDVMNGSSRTPKSATLCFIRQFARTCATIQGCAIGTMILN